MVPYTRQESQLSWLLIGIAIAAVALGAAILVGVSQPASETSMSEPLFVAGTAAGFGLFALLARFAAADVRRYRALIRVLAGGCLFGAFAWLAAYFGRGSEARADTLLAVAVMFGAAALILTGMLRRAEPAAPPWMPWTTDKPLTRWERAGRFIAGGVGFASVAAAVAIVPVAVALAGPQKPVIFPAQPLLVGGAAIGLALFGACALVAAKDVRRYTEMFTLSIAGALLALVATAAYTPPSGVVALASGDRFGVTALIWDSTVLGILIVEAAIAGIFIVLKIGMSGALLDHLSFFTPLQFRALEAVAEVLIEGGASEKVPPYQIALRTDRYLGSFRSNRLWLSKLAVLSLEFAPLLALQPPLSYLNPALRREFVDRHFKRDIVKPRGVYWILDRVGPRRILDLIEGAVRFNLQLTYLGYYSDPIVQREIGYVPFSARPASAAAKVIRRHPPLQVMTPDDLTRRGIDVIDSADVVIVGSGAAGSMLAEQLAGQGRDVLLLEKGPYVNPDDFTEDEVEQISRLYGDGALQISQALRFTVLQGSCVGGTTVVNNAVCFDTPDCVLHTWNDRLDAGIDVSAFRESQAAVNCRMSIQTVDESVLNPGDDVIARGIQGALRPGSYEYGVVRANISGCLGCGYCNIGCRYGRKLSMLDEVLPKAQATYGAQKFRIISEAEATRLHGQDGRVTEIIVRLRGRRELRIRNPRTVVVSAGTIASSWLLMQSGVGQGELPVGRRLCFNMGSPLHGAFEQRLNSHAGLQIAHYLRLPDHPGAIFETWYNPPVAQALAMPGWLDTHFNNMRRYAHMAAVGVLVGTDPDNPKAHLTRALFLRGAPDIVYEPTERDLNTLVEALIGLGKIMFAGGAKEVFASTRHYQSYSRGHSVYHGEDDLERLRELVKKPEDILLGTGHPQGGNAMSKTRGRDGKTGGVVGPDFRVYGYDNLYVCDASVFPGATTVNPQVTVMTMAHYAAGLIS
jgi:choline dehydrogenase-like flavoprotein